MLYSGANDLGNGQSVEDVHGYFRAIWDRLAVDYPDAPVGVIAVRPSPVQWHLREAIVRLNDAMRETIATRPDCAWLDPNPAMVVGPDGELDEGLFVEDRLHLNAKGYEILVNATRDFVTS